MSALRWTAHRAVPALAVALFVTVIVFTSHSDWSLAIGTAAATLSAIAMLAHLAHTPDGWFAWVLSRRPMVWIRQRAYGIYLYHLSFLILFDVRDPEPTWGYAARAALAVVVSLAAAAISFRWIERPAGRWVRTFQERKISSATA